jgi:dihydrofolate reductase
VPTFVLTRHARDPVEMRGGTTFNFVTEGIEAALHRARQAAGDRDVRIGGGAARIRQYLRARLIDEVHLAIRPILMGAGESLFADLDLAALGYRCTQHVSSEVARHVVLRKDA